MSEVLIVDDNHNFRETLRELLSDVGYQTRIATNAGEGIALLQTTIPDLRLCDWKMPGGGGEQFLKSLKSDGLLTTMPVIILTAHGTGPNAIQAMQLGACDFITKPLDIDLALAAVARAIRHIELQREVEVLRQQRFKDSSLEELAQSEEGLKPQLIGNSRHGLKSSRRSAESLLLTWPFCCWANRERVKKLLRARFIKTAREAVVPSSSSTAQRCLPSCWSPNSSDMNAVPSLGSRTETRKV